MLSRCYCRIPSFWTKDWTFPSLSVSAPKKTHWHHQTRENHLWCCVTHTMKLHHLRIEHLREQKLMSCITSILLWDLFFLLTGCPVRSEIREIFPKTETIRSHSSRASNPSSLNPESREMISDSVELCEAAVCLLHMQLMGTNVWLLKTHNVPPEMDFESLRSPAKSETWNNPYLNCLEVLPTWQYCMYSLAWWVYKNQSIQTFVTCFGSFCNGSCELISWP